MRNSVLALLLVPAVAAAAQERIVIVARPPSLELRPGAEAELQMAVDEAPKLRASVGTVHSPRPVASGVFGAKYDPPRAPYPQVAVISATTAKGFGWVAMPLEGTAELEVKTKPYGDAMARVGERSFGPVRADARGRAVIPIVVPPGTTHATVGKRRVALGAPPPSPPLAVLEPESVPAAAPHTVTVRVIAVTPGGEPRRGAPVRLKVSDGVVSPPREVAPGVYEASWAVVSGAPGESSVSATIEGDAGGAARATLLRRAAPGDTRPAPTQPPAVAQAPRSQPAAPTPRPSPTATPPAQAATRPAQTATPPAQTATPPAQAATPPAQTATPPAQAAAPAAPPVAVAPRESAPAPVTAPDTPTRDTRAARSTPAPARSREAPQASGAQTPPDRPSSPSPPAVTPPVAQAPVSPSPQRVPPGPTGGISRRPVIDRPPPDRPSVGFAFGVRSGAAWDEEGLRAITAGVQASIFPAFLGGYLGLAVDANGLAVREDEVVAAADRTVELSTASRVLALQGLALVRAPLLGGHLVLGGGGGSAYGAIRAAARGQRTTEVTGWAPAFTALLGYGHRLGYGSLLLEVRGQHVDAIAKQSVPGALDVVGVSLGYQLGF